ncbi:MAG: NAD(P)/FAD-dependent oxidoreductase [Oscillospiraceae bacterium]|nr:NAD(P)/FAD-dependent oxidoreductase [Oscillospiraceae bacterium]
MQHSDIAIIGGGPAGLSAAINARVRNKRVCLFGSGYKESGLYKAEWLENVLGLPGMTGADYLERCLEQAGGRGVDFVSGRVISIMPTGDKFSISCGADLYTAGAVILSSGIVQKAAFPGERELLGKGVSYCATCDGMLYRKKAVCVVIRSAEGIHEANYLHEIGSTVTVISDGRSLDGLDEAIPVIKGKQIAVLGESQVEGLQVGEETIPCQGVFILRSTVAPSSLLPKLELNDGHIQVDRNMQTNIPGVYAAGDCTGRPYQVAKAVGEGLVAALSAAEYLDRLSK